MQLEPEEAAIVWEAIMSAAYGTPPASADSEASAEAFVEADPAHVAVGTALSGRPPHRSERAELPHSAPTSGHGVKPVPRPRMTDSWTRKPALLQSVDLRPQVRVRLAATP
jgi:hypothetical protein